MTRPTRALAAALLALLAAQYLPGMITNLYAPIPPGRAGAARKPRRPARRGRPLGAPARPARAQDPRRRGLAIGAGAISLAMLSLRARQRPWRLFALLGLFTSVPVGLAGAAFLAYHQDDLYSLLMSIGFLGALFSYGTGLYLTR